MTASRATRNKAKVAVLILNVAALAIFWPFGPKPFFRPTGNCITNLRSYASAFAAYLADHDDGYPDRDRWMTSLRPFGARIDTLYCPSVAAIPGAFGYAMNSDLALRSKGSLADPGTPLIYDSINAGPNASDPLTSAPSPPRHGGRNWILTVEGLVTNFHGGSH